MKKISQDKQLKSVIFVSMTSVCLVFALASIFFFQSYKFDLSKDIDLFMGKMQVVSNAFSSNIPSEYTCDDKNINPPLSIRNLPKETESITIILEDISSLKNDTLWAVWNINPETTNIEEDHIPIGATEGMNDFDKIGYTGPCQHEETHEYKFRIFALSDITTLESGATKDELIEAISPYILEEAELIGTY